MHTYLHTYPTCILSLHTYVHTYLPYIHTYPTYIHTYISTYVHTYIHTYIHAVIHTYIHTYIHAVIHTYIHTYLLTYLHTYIHTYVHKYIQAYIQTYIYTIHKYTYIHTCIHAYMAYMHTCIRSFHIPSCFVTHNLSHSTLSHTTVLTSRSFTASFPFPSFPVPATTFDAHYWKKLTCGVIRSFNFLFAVFWGTLMAGENLACHFIPKICILYGNTVVRVSAHWNLEYLHTGILKYLKKMFFWRHSKFNLPNFGKLGSILSFSVSLYIYILY